MQGESKSFLERAKKLLAMSEDKATTENEKLTAVAMLQKLLFQNNFDMAALQAELGVETSPYIDETFSLGTAYKWRRLLANTLCQYNFCEHCFIIGTTKYMIIGRKDNIEWVMWLHKHIRKQIEHMAREYLVTATFGKSETWIKTYKNEIYNSFCRGCVNTIKARLQQERAELLQDETNRALVVVEDSALRKRLEELVPNVRNVRLNRQNLWEGAYNAGRNAGQNISMHRQIQ